MAAEKVANTTIYRMLDRHNWRTIIPRPRHPNTNTEAQEGFKKLPKMVTRCAEALASVGVRSRIMLQDEGRFGRLSNPCLCWAPQGMRPNVPNQMVREYTCAYAAVSPHDSTMDSLVIPEVNEQAMSIVNYSTSF
jgi:hypothetical protein